MTAMNGKECQTSKVSRVAWEMMWTERQQHSWLRRLPLAAAAALPSTHPPVHRQADTNRQIQNSVINTSTCHTHTQALKYFNYYRPASLALYKTLVVSQAQTHERQAAYHVSTVTGHLSQSPQDSSLQALLSMTSQFSCRAREVTCHYWHVNRFCYLLTYLLIYLYRQTDRYKQTDRYI